MILDYDEGGLKLVDLPTKNKSLKITWIQKILGSKATWCTFAHNDLPIDNKLIWQCNLHKKDVKIDCKPGFWTDVLSVWCDINCNTSQNLRDVEAEIIWFNHQIRDRNGKMLFVKELMIAGINTVSHFIDYQNHCFVRINGFINCTSVTIDVITYHRINCLCVSVFVESIT